MASSLNETPAAERVHIGLFGCRNAGKSSLINALTGQDLSIVSDFKGTTTDPRLQGHGNPSSWPRTDYRYTWP